MHNSYIAQLLLMVQQCSYENYTSNKKNMENNTVYIIETKLYISTGDSIQKYNSTVLACTVCDM